jgi:hypothetical protein
METEMRERAFRVWWLPLLLFIAGGVGLHGCSPATTQPPKTADDNNRPPLVSEVTIGRVMFEDEPVMLGLVFLHGDNGPIVHTRIMPDGLFHVAGVPEGEYRVSIQIVEHIDSAMVMGAPRPEEGKDKTPPEGKDKTPPEGKDKTPPRPDGPQRDPGPPGKPPGPPGRPPAPSVPAVKTHFLLPPKTDVEKLRETYARIDPKYRDPKTSGLRIRIKKGGDQVEPYILVGASKPDAEK